MTNLISLQYRRVPSGTAMGVLLAVLLLVVSVAPAQGQSVIATVPVGQVPISVAVNPVTDKIYVSNLGSGTISVIDGATNSATTIGVPNASLMQGIRVNPVTNKVYVAVWNGVSVIDGATNALTAVTDPNASGSHWVTVNSVTNKIYVANWNSSNITVIDGATNATISVHTGANPHHIAVNPVTNKIYVSNYGSGDVTIIDGATNSTTTVRDPDASVPVYAAVNSVTNKIYVANNGSNNITVIDGATNSLTTVTDPNAIAPGSVALNSVTNKVYVVNGGTGPYAGSSNVTVIDGATNSTTTVTDPNANDSNWVVVDSATNKAYVANWGSNNVTVIDGATNSTTTVTDSKAVHPAYLDVDSATNRVYVINGGGYPYGGSNNVTVIAGGAPITLSPLSLDFGSQLLNTTSQPQTVTLTNSGETTLDISSIVASANYSQTNDCGSSMLAGASCTIAVTFRPTKTSTCAETGTLTVTEDGSSSPQTVKLTGAGTVVTLSVKSLNFGDQPVGTTSSAKTFTFTNHATSRAVSIPAISISGPNSPAFAQTNTCGTSLAAGASCTLSVTFTPHGKGSKAATLNLWDNGGGGPHTMTLTGLGT